LQLTKKSKTVKSNYKTHMKEPITKKIPTVIEESQVGV